MQGRPVLLALTEQDPLYAGSLVENLPLVARLGQAARSDHSPIVEAIKGLLKSVECRDTLLRGLKSNDRSVRRICFRLATEAESLDTRAVLERALTDRDTVIRLWAARQFSAGLGGDATEGLLETMNRDRFMPVRREAMWAFVRLLPRRATAELLRMLFDHHASFTVRLWRAG